MTHRDYKSKLTGKLTLLIAIALLVSGTVFAISQKVTDDLINNYLNSNEYYEKESARYIERFSNYVSSQRLSTSDRQAFEEWAKKENYILLSISKNGILQFDSTYSKSDESAYGKEKVSQYHQNHSRNVAFSDGEAQVMIDGFYSSRYFGLAFVIELLGATLIFLTIILLGIRKSLNYLKKIHQEIHILEGGELDYQMTVKGNDELARIAESIEGLRKAFLGKLRAIEDLQKESRDLVTEISHDMRTPLTSLMMYLEFAKKERGEAPIEEKAGYVDNAYQKALQLKSMSDNLFAYFLLDKEAEAELETVAVKEVIYDLMSDQIAILHQEHFDVSISGELPDTYMDVSMEELGRVFDNLMSNLLKYADPKEKIHIIFTGNQETFEIRIHNKIKKTNTSIESNRLGERSIGRMMNRMQAQFKSTQEDEEYLILLRFWNTKR
ncbi:HAMP domain-containing sensor histidine kinase [Saccharibacillus sp. JS10]|uniref:sensor histidine kinase n=1 Tax=Saccharibacillus sp. JS10 TaxID=2950552 RepID=UPI002109003D|nr:HAMP domain-containing sensor histidine kinase [Saccharibacillus sp. JS10]MCQ4087816.1 HAMP domain-containing histidine kinase [Saccharibacillus sp. JS10]